MNRDTKTALIVGGIALAILIAVPLLWGGLAGWQGGGWGMMGPGMMGPGMMGGFGWGWFMPIFLILFWVLIVWAVVTFVRGVAWPGGSHSASSRTDSAMEVLRRRYARGEVSKEEYEEKKRDLA